MGNFYSSIKDIERVNATVSKMVGEMQNDAAADQQDCRGCLAHEHDGGEGVGEPVARGGFPRSDQSVRVDNERDPALFSGQRKHV